MSSFLMTCEEKEKEKKKEKERVRQRRKSKQGKRSATLRKESNELGC